MTPVEDENIIKQCMDFLKRSSKRYCTEMARQIKNLQAYSGDFWDAETKKTYHRTGKRKLNLHFSDWSVLASAIASPFSRSSWHTDLVNREGANEDSQTAINTFESDSDYKSASKSALMRMIIAGSGFINITTDIDPLTKEPKLVADFVHRQDTVALDPDIQTVDGSDAEEGALVNYISVKKAKRMYGDDVLPYDYPRAVPKMNFTNITQWANEEDKVQVVTYYCKNKAGTVDYYKICGNKVIEFMALPIKYIPIVRFAGWLKYTNDGLDFSGIVEKTYFLQLGLNIAYSTLIERANRSIKANLIASVDAVENLDPYYQKMTEEDGSLILHNKGTAAPTPIVEQFNTGDLRDVIDQTRTLIADVVGIPLAGILGADKDKTATEVLIQANNNESNVSELYDNAYRACRTISRIIIELLNNGADVLFELTNGPDVISNNMKHRQELSAVASLLPPEMQALAAVYMSETISSEFGKRLHDDIVANLNADLKLVAESQDPVALHQIKQMKMLLDQYAQELEAAKAQAADQQKEIETLNIAMMNQKESHMIDLQKHQDDMAFKNRELDLKAAEQGVQLQNDSQLANVKLQEAVLKLETEKMKIVDKAINGGV